MRYSSFHRSSNGPSALQRMRQNLARQSYEDIERAVQQDERQNSASMILIHRGWRNGYNIAETTTGKVIPVDLVSNGAIREGDVYTGRRSRLSSRVSGTGVMNYSG